MKRLPNGRLRQRSILIGTIEFYRYLYYTNRRITVGKYYHIFTSIGSKKGTIVGAAYR
ncbi:hypothetical protein [Chamaesiphon sp. GL140_3_metabinner_50]|uniref:hypothetical protein n=1 Tax=Chamaesiphon sp. GL140_3_metabinner_50 TaxID=2970812 RepID=UPI0025DDDD5D|nr:hypothetical protein [Chamaesiphon sp. GL140_3_metabinner_50]